MSEAWFADRVTLYHLHQDHPEWSTRHLAEHLARSHAWVKKWLHRFGTPPSPDLAVCARRSSARQHPPPPLSERVIARILALRDELAVQFNRVVGPKTILWYLRQDATLSDERLPQSPTTIWKVLDRHHRIVRQRPFRRHRIDRPAPLTEIEIDFTDVTAIPGDRETKLQHAVEAFNWVDRGTSIAVASRVSDNFHAASTIAMCAEIVHEIGLPDRIRCDRDSRFIGNNRRADFPAPFMRFWLNLQVAVDLCPPQRPDLKPFVERFNRTYQDECLTKNPPSTVGEAQAWTDQFREWYCRERPHQGTACQNQPPLVAFPDLPPRRAVPAMVDADGWLMMIDGHTYVRKVDSHGFVTLDRGKYYINHQVIGQEVTLQVVARTREFRVLQREQEIKRLAIKRLINATLSFDAMVAELCQLAEREEARLHIRHRQRKPQAWSRGG